MSVNARRIPTVINTSPFFHEGNEETSMKAYTLSFLLLSGLSLASSACGGGDDDSGGTAGCAHAQMLCAKDQSVTIDCDQYDKAPASIKDCVGKATTCDGVAKCLLGGS
jgi:hypothetical protein